MERHFDLELKELKEKLLKMSSLVEEAISLSIKALKDRDQGLAQKVINSDDAINMLEIEIDDISIKLLALRQPEARDLRFIISAIKINSDLERMGDQAVNIAELALNLLKSPPLKPLIDIPKMSDLAQGMLRDSLNAFINSDPYLAKSVCERDDEVDNLNDMVFNELITYMKQDPKNVERALDLILIARDLERVADLSTNICEDVIYIASGRVIKHHLEERGQ